MFRPPEAGPAAPTTQIEAAEHTWRVVRDLDTEASTLEVVHDDGVQHLEDIDLVVHSGAREWYRTVGDDMTSARGSTHWVHEFRRGPWQVRTETTQTLTCDERTFFLHATLDAYEGDERVFSRNWRRAIERLLV